MMINDRDFAHPVLGTSEENNNLNACMAGMELYIRDYYEDERFDPRKVHEMVAKEMMQLNAGDRNRISEEIHGVQCMAVEEDLEMLKSKLRELDVELSKIPPSKKRAFALATSVPSSAYGQIYVNSPEFRLKFLRSEFFHAKKAAYRMVNYLDLIAFRFPFDKGLEVLHRPIVLNDFSDEEQCIIRKGVLQLLPFRDRSGRRVLTGVDTLGITYDPAVWYKILLYFMQVAGEDAESQEKGIVVVLWPSPEISDSIPNKLRFPIHKGTDLLSSIVRFAPIRVVAFHFCTPPATPFFQVLRSVFALALCGKQSRIKYHSGEPVELRYQIKSYGIPVDLLPLTLTGNVKTSYLKQWLRLRSTIEDGILQNYTLGLLDQHHHGSHLCPSQRSRQSQSHQSSRYGDFKFYGVKILIECPGSKDVVFRPGRPVMNHPGNVTFRSLIESKSCLHDSATQTQKSMIAKTVVDEMIDVQGGRFLVWDEPSGSWTAIMDPHKQRHKVAIAFRNFKSNKRSHLQRQISSNSNNSVTSNNSVNITNSVTNNNNNCATANATAAVEETASNASSVLVSSSADVAAVSSPPQTCEGPEHTNNNNNNNNNNNDVAVAATEESGTIDNNNNTKSSRKRSFSFM